MGLGLVMIGVHAGAGFCVDDEGGGVGFGLSDEINCASLVVAIISASGSAWGRGRADESQEKGLHRELN
jgi:hypothetical protein